MHKELGREPLEKIPTWKTKNEKGNDIKMILRTSCKSAYWIVQAYGCVH
jgi:hypothetical protein